MMHKIKMPKDGNKYEYFYYLTCGYDTHEIEGRIKHENTVRYSAIKKICETKPLKMVELTTEEQKEVAAYLQDAIDIKKDHITETGQSYSNKYDWTQARQNALVKYYQKYF